MAKQQRKHQLIKSPQGQGQMIEEIFDDNLLPDASEVERLYKMDPKILEWLKSSAEKEQDFRHKIYKEKVDLVRRADSGDRIINLLGLIFSFVIVIGGMLFSAYLISLGHLVLGSIFGGTIIVSIVGSFLSKVNKQC
ncbi:hypothetical protein [Ornithobacterium rhinotracheale]|uniref:hypothetical protein n=1 Tax=Ornithobacterium rhinotracheale TaxID=28251 RepID=UPI0040371AEE